MGLQVRAEGSMMGVHSKLLNLGENKRKRRLSFRSYPWRQRMLTRRRKRHAHNEYSVSLGMELVVAVHRFDLRKNIDEQVLHEGLLN